jgi:hypothetical protein
LRPGEVARAKRVARMIANTVQPQRTLAVRNVIARLKVHNLRPRDIDTPNGEDAIAAIVSTMTAHEMRNTVPSLGKIWELVASRAVQFLGKNAYR